MTGKDWMTEASEEIAEATRGTAYASPKWIRGTIAKHCPFKPELPNWTVRPSSSTT